MLARKTWSRGFIAAKLLTELLAAAFLLPSRTRGSRNTGCYSGPTLIPVLPLSCNPLTIPATCPPGAVNMTAAKGVSGRLLDPTICAHFPYSNATRPFPTPSPPAPISGAPPPSVVTPSPPSASPPPAGPSPSPPPPKAAGPSGVSLAAAVLPLLMVVLMAGV
ncbi:unnamed protein product [Closterium sp. Naga37s-1]|nr:unnamed protein product [Closterium sp. Naga37s-1]